MNIILGVTGSVAAYRAADLARDAMRKGHEVRVCLTRSAAKFVSPALFEALTGNPCIVDVFTEPVAGRMAHIDWARWAEAILIAPATANTISKIAFGIGNDMLSTIVLASRAPLFVAPAMNPTMYEDEAFQASLKVLKSRATSIIEPVSGDVACGENGQGKLASNSSILQVMEKILARPQYLRGKKLLITSGPTQEPIDEVRFLSNRSSGKMGAALARAGILLGADVTVITGPVAIQYPIEATTIKIQTANEMLKEVGRCFYNCDILIGAAAVADYRPLNFQKGKLRRTPQNLNLELVPNPDILAEFGKLAKKHQSVIGFAAEPNEDLTEAREKIIRKNLKGIAVNNFKQKGIGFDSDENEITYLTSGGNEFNSGILSKLECAIWLLELVF